MPNIIFSEGAGIADSIYGNCQAPVRMLLEKRGEEFEQQSILKDLFMMSTSENFADIFTSMTGMDGFDPVGENGAYPEDGMQEGYQKMLRSETWKNSFRISEEMIEDAKAMNLRQAPENFYTSYYRTREKFGLALFGGAIQGMKRIQYRGKWFDTTSADGVSMFHTEHKPKVSGAKQANMFSDAFDDDALGKMETAMQNYRGDNDEILDVHPDTIVIPNIASLKKKVFAAIGADKDPLTANNAFNYQFGRWNVIVSNYLNQYIPKGTAPWILMDSRYNQTYGGAVWNDRVALRVRSTIDENTDANVWRGRSRFNACFNDWRFAAVGGVEAGIPLPND